jgi:hypothetical protein
MKRRNNENQCKITGVEIAEQMGIQPQLVSLDIKTIMNLDMIRKGRHSLLMINPHMWIFGEWHARNHAIELWNDLPQTSNRLIIGGIKRYR